MDLEYGNARERMLNEVSFGHSKERKMRVTKISFVSGLFSAFRMLKRKAYMKNLADYILVICLNIILMSTYKLVTQVISSGLCLC